MSDGQMIDAKKFWEAKILSWEVGRYQAPSVTDNFLERLASRASNSLRFRLWATGEILASQVLGKRVLELGCGSGFLAARLLAAGAKSYIGIDISECAIANARLVANEAGLKDQVSFEVGSVMNMTMPKSDIVFSLGLLDWLTDAELDCLFSVTAKADCLHAIAEKRVSLSQWLHRVYVQLAYGHRTGTYRPRYFSVEDIKAIMHQYTDKPIQAYRDSRLSFGALLTTFDFDPQIVAHEPLDSLR